MQLPTKTTLPIDDPERLLAALQGEVDPAQLLRVDKVQLQPNGSYRSVHAHVLSRFLTGSDLYAADDAEAQHLYGCCLRLIELRAPMTDAYGDGALSQFCAYPWPLIPYQIRLVSDLADVYVRAGQLELGTPMPGQPLDRQARYALNGSNQEGLVPLAIAILESNPPLARYLVDRGVSLKLGVVYAGETAVSAIDLAREMGEAAIHACLVESMLRQRLAEDPPVESPRKPRRASL